MSTSNSVSKPVEGKLVSAPSAMLLRWLGPPPAAWDRIEGRAGGYWLVRSVHVLHDDESAPEPRLKLVASRHEGLPPRSPAL